MLPGVHDQRPKAHLWTGIRDCYELAGSLYNSNAYLYRTLRLCRLGVIRCKRAHWSADNWVSAKERDGRKKEGNRKNVMMISMPAIMKMIFHYAADDYYYENICSKWAWNYIYSQSMLGNIICKHTIMDAQHQFRQTIFDLPLLKAYICQ